MKKQTVSPGAALRMLREMADLTLKQVASGADTSIAYLSKVENGALLPTRNYVARVTGFIASEMQRAA